jgi:cell division protein FtsB
MMDWQFFINAAIAAVFGVLGWFAKQMWLAVHQLKNDLKDLEVKLPDMYVRRDDFKSVIAEVKEDMKELRKDMKESFNKVDSTLNAIYRKLDNDKRD